MTRPPFGEETDLRPLTANGRTSQGLPRLILADEAAPSHSPTREIGWLDGLPVGVLIGPEGGFSEAERELLLAQDFVLPISLGPRILRADTAAAAAHTLDHVIIRTSHIIHLFHHTTCLKY